jgi:hypothetical protein
VECGAAPGVHGCGIRARVVDEELERRLLIHPRRVVNRRPPALVYSAELHPVVQQKLTAASVTCTVIDKRTFKTCFRCVL